MAQKGQGAEVPQIQPEALAAPINTEPLTDPKPTTQTTAESLPSTDPSLHEDDEKREVFEDEEEGEPATQAQQQQQQQQRQDGDLARQKSAAPSEPEYPPPVQVAIIMLSILMAMFLMSLDRTIIATAIPSITNEFHSLDDIGWYGSAFMLTASCFQLLWGRIYTFYPPKYVFLTLVGIFEIGSAICGAAPNSIAFIIGRAIAGMGSAGIMSGAIVLMVSAVPLAKRPFYNGLFGAVFGLSSVIGPLLGGAFTTDVSWRWCFYINLPIGGVAMLAILFILKPTPPAQPGLTFRQKVAQLDLLGELFLFPCIICLLLALQWGGSTYSWSNWRLIVLWIFFAVTLIAFIIVEVVFQKSATIQARVIKQRSIVAGMWFVFCLASSMLMLVYYLPTWFQAIKNKSAVDSGIDTIPLVLSLVVGSIFSGQMVGRLGYYTPFAIASSILMPIGAGLLTTLQLNTPSGKWIGYQILFGLGIGCGMQQGPMAAQTVLARKDVPMGVSLMFFVQQLGGAIFVSVGQNVFNEHLLSGLTAAIPDLSPSEILNTGATDLRGIVPQQDITEVLVVYNDALRWTFIVGLIMSCFAIFGSASMEWRSIKGKQGPGGGGPPPKKPASDEEAQPQTQGEKPTETVQERPAGEEKI